MARNGNQSMAVLKNIAPAIERKAIAVTANSSIIGEIARIMPRIGKDEVSIGIGARGKISFSLPLDKYTLFVANLVCGDQAKREVAAALTVLRGFTAEIARKCVEVSAKAGALDVLFEAIAKSLPKDKGSVTMSTGGKGGASFRLTVEEYTMMVANLICGAQQNEKAAPVAGEGTIQAPVPTEKPVPAAKTPGAMLGELDLQKQAEASVPAEPQGGVAPKKRGRPRYLSDEERIEHRRKKRLAAGTAAAGGEEKAPAEVAETAGGAGKAGKPRTKRFRSLADDQVIEAVVVPSINSPIAAIKKVKKADVSYSNEIEGQLHAAVQQLAARAFPLANERKSARLMKNLSVQELMERIKGLCDEHGVRCGRLSEPKDMPKNLYFDRELLGGIVKVFALKAIQNIKSGKADVKEVCGAIHMADEPDKIVIVIRGMSNGVHMQDDGRFTEIRKSRYGNLAVQRKAGAKPSTRGPLDVNEAEVFNKALGLLRAERSPIGNDGVKLIVPGSEWNPGRKPGSKKAGQ